MPQRVHGVLLALAGIVAVAGLSFVGRDVWLHARAGPRWKRRLVAAGLWLLSSLGLVSCGVPVEEHAQADAASPSPKTVQAFRGMEDRYRSQPYLKWLVQHGELSPGLRERLLASVEQDIETVCSVVGDRFLRVPARDAWDDIDDRYALVDLIRLAAKLVEQSGRPLDETRAWRRIAALWHDAGEIGSGRRGAYPYDIAGRIRLQRDAAVAGVDALVLKAAALITEPEAELLWTGLVHLMEDVQWRRAVEGMHATCYMGMLDDPRGDSPERLFDRLKALKRLAASEVLHESALEQALVPVLRDLAYVRDNVWSRPGALALENVARSAEEAAKALAALEERVDDTRPALESAPEWDVISRAFRQALPLAEKGERTAAEGGRLVRSLGEARRAAVMLYLRGALTLEEATLVVFEAEALRGKTCRLEPTDVPQDFLLHYELGDRIPAWYPGGPTQPAEEAERYRRDGEASMSHWRLSSDLPRIRKALKGRAVRAALWRLLLPSLELDVSFFRAGKVDGQPYWASKHEKPEGWLRDAEATVAEIRELLAAGGE